MYPTTKITSLTKVMVYITIVITSSLVHETQEDGSGGLRIRREAKGRCYPETGFCEYEDYFQNPLQTHEFCLDRNAGCTTDTCKECKCKADYGNFLSYTYGCMGYEKAKFFLSRGMCNGLFFTCP